MLSTKVQVLACGSTRIRMLSRRAPTLSQIEANLDRLLIQRQRPTERYQSNKSGDVWSKGRELFQKQSEQATKKAADLLKRGSQYASESVSKGAEQVSQKTSQAIEHSTKIASKTLERSSSTLKDQSKKWAETAAEKSSELAGKASQTAANAMKQSTVSIKSTASASTETAESAAKKIKATTVTFVSRLSDTVQGFAKATLSKSISILTSPFRSAWQAASKSAQSMYGKRDKYIKALWWWSLAAIGVYGFATALPREIIRAAMTRDDDKKEQTASAVRVDESSSSTTSSSNKKGLSSWWSSGDSPSAGAQAS